MQKTMVVSPGQPPPGQYGQQNFGAPPPGGPAAPPKKSRLGLWLGLGCGCLTLVGVLIAISVYFLVVAVAPGSEISSVNIQPNGPFTVSYTQSGDGEHEVWLELDVSYAQGFQLVGPINIAVNNQPWGQYNLEMTGSGTPIRERANSGTRKVGWVSTNLNGNGATSGKIFLFPLPRRDEGSVVTLSGTITAAQGMTARQLRIFVTD